MIDTNKHGMVGKVNKTLHTKRPASSHQHTKTAGARPRQADLLRVHISVGKQPPDLFTAITNDNLLHNILYQRAEDKNNTATGTLSFILSLNLHCIQIMKLAD